MDFWVSLLIGFLFYGGIYSLIFFVLEGLTQHYIGKLCKYRGTGEPPGPVCVICAYHHRCHRAKRSAEYRKYSYWRRLLPQKAKKIFDEIWEAEAAKISGEK